MLNNIEINKFYQQTLTLASDEEQRYDAIIELSKYELVDAKKEFIEILEWFRKKAYSKSSGGGPQWASEEIQNQYKDDPYRFVHEFIQNIDDCNYIVEKPSLTINVGENYLAFEYDETGFTINDIHSLCYFGYSNKKVNEISNENKIKKIGIFSNAKTGEKGIGFKSVFGISNKVYIESNGYKFYLTKEKSIVPIWFDSINKELSLQENEFKEIKNGTRIILTELDKNFNVKNVIDEIKSKYLSRDNLLDRNILLFTKNLKKITIDKEEYSIDEDIKNAEYDGELCIIDDNIHQLEGIEHDGKLYKSVIYDATLKMDGDEPKKVMKYVKTIVIEDEVVKDRFLELTHSQTRNISMVIDLEGKSKGGLYTTLPLSHNLGIPIAIDAPFKLNTNRTGIDENNAKEWNKKVLGFIFDKEEILEEAFIKIRDKENVDITKFINASRDIFSIDLSEKIKSYPIFEQYIEDNKEKEWISLKELCILDEFEYEFPQLLTLFSYIDVDKTLAHKKYIGKLNKEYVLDWKGSFVEVLNQYLNKVEINEENMSKILDLIESNFEELFKKQDLKKLEIFKYTALNYDGTSEYVRSSINEEEFWINDKNIKSFNDKFSFDKYRLLSTSVFDNEKHTNLISLLDCKNYENFIEDIKKRASITKTIDECIEVLKVMFYYGVKGKKIPFLRECSLSKEFDKAKNLFRDKGVLHEINEDILDEIAIIAKIYIDEVANQIISCGLRRAEEFFDYASKDFIDLDDKTKELLNKDEDESAIKSIEKAFKNLKVSKESLKLKIEYDNCIPVNVKKYIIENKVIQGDVLKEFCEQVSLNDSDSVLILLALNELELSNFENEFKVTLDDAKSLVYEDKDDKGYNITVSVINNVMKKHKLSALEIKIEGNEVTEYNNETFKDAIDQFYKQNKNIFTEKSYWTADLGNIDYLYDSKNVIFNKENTDQCLLKYVKDTSGKDDFKNYMEFATKEKYFKIEKPETKEECKKFIKELSEFRTLNYKTSLTDIGRLIEQLNNANDKSDKYVLYEILQNINDARKEKVEQESVTDVSFDFEEVKMIVEYFEVGFTAQDVYNITSLSAVSKTDEETGEKGIGFKAIFSIFSDVEIHSNNFHFHLFNSGENKPKFIVPEWVESEYEGYKNKTKMIFTLKNLKNFDMLQSQLKDTTTFLFLKNISTIKINGYEMNLEKIRTENYHSYEESLYLKIDNAVMKKRDKWKQKRDDELQEIKEKLTVDVFISKNINEEEKGYIYATLPTEQLIDPRIYLNAPFELTTGRNKLLGSEYNKSLKEIVFGSENNSECVFKRAMEEFAEKRKLKNKLLAYLPKSSNEFISKNVLRSIKFLETYKTNELVSIYYGFTVTSLLYNFINSKEDNWQGIYKFLQEEFSENKEYPMIKVDINELEKLNDYAVSLGEKEEWFPRATDLKKLLDFFVTIYDRDCLYDEEKERLHKFLKNDFWKAVKDYGVKRFYNLYIFPYKTEKGARLSKFEAEKWYELKSNKYNKYNSTESYKILDKSLLGDIEFYFGDDIHEFNENIVIQALKSEMKNEEQYTDLWWSKAREIYNLRKQMKEGE